MVPMYWEILAANESYTQSRFIEIGRKLSLNVSIALVAHELSYVS